MATNRFLGMYARFDTASKKDSAVLLGADCLVGDAFEIVFKTEDGVTVAWIKNRFGAEVGFLDPSVSRQLSIAAARDWKLRAILSFVAFTDSPDPGHYWGECAVMAWDPHINSAMEAFAERVAARLAEGVRPAVDLGEQGVDQVIESDGSWQPTKTVPLPPKKAGTVIMKSRRKLSEKIVEEGRKGNKGCYVLSWVFLLAIVTLLVIFGKGCFGF